MRTARVFLPQSSVFSAWITLALAATFSLGATESSRSRKTRSARLPAAFSIMRSLLAGVESSHRLRRMLFSLLIFRVIPAQLRHLLVPFALPRFVGGSGRHHDAPFEREDSFAALVIGDGFYSDDAAIRPAAR